MIQAYDSEDSPISADGIKQLKRWYLSGFKPGKDEQGRPMVLQAPEAFINLLDDPVLASYEVSFEKEMINEDPTRRFFETHLAHHTLSSHIDDFDLSELRTYRQYLLRVFQIYDRKIAHYEGLVDQIENPQDRKKVAAYIAKLNHKKNLLSCAFHGIDHEALPDQYKEYAHFIKAITEGFTGPFTEYSDEQREKVTILVQCAILGIANAQEDKNLPIDIYDKKSRGKVMKEPEVEQDEAGHERETNDPTTARSQHMGIIRPHHPLPSDDIARTEDIVFDILKPSDQATFEEDALWVEYNFAHGVHPYSNAISGTMLCQLRNLEAIHRQDAEFDIGGVGTAWWIIHVDLPQQCC